MNSLLSRRRSFVIVLLALSLTAATVPSGKPEDVGHMVRFLCGPGSRYVTGQVFHVDGGMVM